MYVLVLHLYLVSTFVSGGCLKRAVARANLTRIVRGHIITPQQFYEFCRENVRGVTVLWCSEDDINLLMQEKLSERYATAKKVFHSLMFHFVFNLKTLNYGNLRMLILNHKNNRK